MTTRWYVATTKNQQETLAAANLREQGFGVYLPKRYWRHQDGRRIEPLAGLRFTGYIFVQFDAQAEEHGPISNTRGVDDLLLNSAGEPLALPDRVVEILQWTEDDEFAVAATRRKVKARDDLTAGDLVMIDDRQHTAHGQRGHFMASVKGLASILCGMTVFKIADIYLKKVEKEQRTAA